MEKNSKKAETLIKMWKRVAPVVCSAAILQ